MLDVHKTRTPLRTSWQPRGPWPTPIRAGTPAGAERLVRRWALWFNGHRPHQGLDGCTPNEACAGSRDRMVRRPTALRYRLEREYVAGDTALPIYRLGRVA